MMASTQPGVYIRNMAFNSTRGVYSCDGTKQSGLLPYDISALAQCTAVFGKDWWTIYFGFTLYTFQFDHLQKVNSHAPTKVIGINLLPTASQLVGQFIPIFESIQSPQHRKCRQ